MTVLTMQCFPSCSHGSSTNVVKIPLAEEAFHSLPPDEQERVSRDLYGTEEPIEESPEFIEKVLTDLDKELSLLGEKIKRPYNLALQNEASSDPYVTSPKFRLVFLRADRFDAHMAARRLIGYFKEKLELFGEETLSRRINQADFAYHEDKKALISGAIAFTGATDWAGRSIVIVRRQQLLRQNLISVKRVAFFTMQNIVEENETAQKKGVVFVGYNMAAPRFKARPSDVRILFPLLRLIRHLPYRIAGIHFCYESIQEHFIINLMLVVLSKDARARFCPHYQETHVECMLKLLQFGIDPNSLPLNSEGNFRHDMLFEYLKRRRELEE